MAAAQSGGAPSGADEETRWGHSSPHFTVLRSEKYSTTGGNLTQKHDIFGKSNLVSPLMVKTNTSRYFLRKSGSHPPRPWWVGGDHFWGVKKLSLCTENKGKPPGCTNSPNPETPILKTSEAKAPLQSIAGCARLIGWVQKILFRVPEGGKVAQPTSTPDPKVKGGVPRVKCLLSFLPMKHYRTTGRSPLQKQPVQTASAKLVLDTRGRPWLLIRVDLGHRVMVLHLPKEVVEVVEGGGLLHGRHEGIPPEG